MNFYKRYPADYANDTRHLSFVEHGAYTLMLDLYYATEEPLPADPEELYRKLCAKTKKERDAINIVLRDFFTKEARANQHAGRSIATHRRVEGEIKKYKDSVKLGKINGLKGGRPKRQNNHTPFQNETQNNHNQKLEARGEIQNQKEQIQIQSQIPRGKDSRAPHNPETVRRIEEKQKRLEKESSSRLESRAGLMEYGTVAVRSEIMQREFDRRKSQDGALWVSEQLADLAGKKAM